MTDNVKRLRAMAQGEARSGIGRQRRDVFEAAADEIECLRAENRHNADGWKWASANVEKLHNEIARLQAKIDRLPSQQVESIGEIVSNLRKPDNKGVA